jgi:hypothetical protein
MLSSTLFTLATPLLLSRIPAHPTIADVPSEATVHSVAIEEKPGDTEPPTVEERQSPARSLSTGVASSVGIGAGYGGLVGLQLAVPFALTSTAFQVGPYSALGVVPGVDEVDSSMGVSIGALGFWGERHRGFAMLDVGPLARAGLQLHGTVVAARTLYGPAALAGYEFMSHGGFLVRVGLGGAMIWTRGLSAVQLTLGVGWKL